MTHWSILTFVMTFAFCHNVQGQINYTYNNTGGCTSRTKTQPQFYQNACAARLSYAFNKAGIKIPCNKWTQQGKGKLNYFLKASHMVRWMKRRWGAPTLVTKAKQLTTGFTTQTGFRNNISGHVDVMYNNKDVTGHVKDYFNNGAPTSIWYGR